jgi:hypothetical protein
MFMQILDFEPEEIGRMVTINMEGIPPNTRSAQVTVRIRGDQQGRAAVSPTIQRIQFSTNTDVKAGIVKVEIATDEGTLEAESANAYIPHAEEDHLGNKAPTVTSVTPITQQPGGVVKLSGKKLDRVGRVRIGFNSSNQTTPTSVTANQISFTIPVSAKTGPNPLPLWLGDKSGKYIRTTFTLTIKPANVGH